ncbi:MAG: S8 family serine peptidase [Xenococcus sp. (in: cyanobacteria)]
MENILLNDPLLSLQWHLSNSGQSGGTIVEDIKALEAWQIATGNGVVIGIVDDGLQYTHSDLINQYLANLSYDFVNNDADPFPDNNQFHGTAVAGIAASQGNNGIGGSGVAYNADLAGLRIASNTGLTLDALDSQLAAALSYKIQDIDIYNNSWRLGFPLIPLGESTANAIENGIFQGRGGLGNIYVFGAGNEAETGGNVNYNRLANSHYTIAVGEIDHNGIKSSFSNPGASLLISAYGSTGDGGLITTDLLGDEGLNLNLSSFPVDDDYTEFSGTSAAAPVVSGVIALMLEANPSLTWRDVQHILVETATQNDPNNPDWIANDAGFLVNHNYGFGAINAGAAVEAALTWQTLEPEYSYATVELGTSWSRDSNNPTQFTRTSRIEEDLNIEWVEISITPPSVNSSDKFDVLDKDVELILTSPQGTSSILSSTGSDSFFDTDRWTFTSARHWGESSAGEWTLTVINDQNTAEEFQRPDFVNWELQFYGTRDKISPDDFLFEFVSPGNSQVTSRLTLGELDLQLADALSYEIQDIDIYNNSLQLGLPLVPLGEAATNAIENVIANGRGGLGSIYVFGTGDSETGGDVNHNALANSRYTIAVGDINHNEVSNIGASLLISADGTDRDGSLTTTDLRLIATNLGSEDGLNINLPAFSPLYNEESRFYGTAAAADVVSDVIASMLAINPSLTWRDVQHILVQTAIQNDPDHPDWIANGAGFLVNHNYGFGAIDVEAAKDEAFTWQTIESEIPYSTGELDTGWRRDDNDPTMFTRSTRIEEDLNLEWVEIIISPPSFNSFDRFDVLDPDIELILTSPQGTSSILSSTISDPFFDTDQWTFTSARHWGESSAGRWTLTVVNDQNTAEDFEQPEFINWELNFYGTSGRISPGVIPIDPTAPDTPLFTIDRNASPETINIAPNRINFLSSDNCNNPPNINNGNEDSIFNTSIYRFQNSAFPGTYLFAGESESQSIRDNFPNFIEEGQAFNVATEPGDDLIRINRFQNINVPGTYLYAGESESQSIRQNFSNFIEEGIAFYVYHGAADRGIDIYRFQNLNVPGTYLFVGCEERLNILTNFPNFVEEGVAFEVEI